MKLEEVDSIDEVIDQLEAFIDHAIATDNRMGYFASLYCAVTKEVKCGIERGRFDDGARMEALDVNFANYFFRATYISSEVWESAFTAAQLPRYVLLQHLLLGMNAHINFDLALAVKESVGAYEMADLLRDYEEINSILIEQIDTMQERVNQSWWVYRVLDYIALRFDEALVGFSLIKARESAWENALKMQRAQNQDVVVNSMQNLTLSFAKAIKEPKGLIKLLVWLNHLFEPKSVSNLIGIINNK